MHSRSAVRSSWLQQWSFHRSLHVHAPSKSAVAVRASAAPVSDAKNLDFVAELKRYSMKLHKRPSKTTEEQKTDGPKPLEQWVITVEGYLQFLMETRLVFQAFEQIIHANDSYSMFRDTGLDRVTALNHDIDWISVEYDLPVSSVSEDGPGATYARKLNDLSVTSVPLFICHFYNYYLAHTAGGRMIGKKAADMALSGAFERLAFYQYNEDLKTLVDNFKKTLNSVAMDWTDEERALSIKETPVCFENAGTIMKTLFSVDT